LANKDLFAPPTKEELDIFGPPSKEELALLGQTPPDEGSDLKDILRGGAEGLSAGFADELYGAGAGSIPGAAKQASTMISEVGEGNVGPASILNPLSLLPKFNDEDTAAYKEARDLSRKSLSESEERSPWLTKGAELLGGVIAPGGAAAKGLSTSAKIMKGAGVGAALGGVAGAGSSTAESGKELASDVLSGAGVGTVLGGAAGAIGKGMKAAKEGIAESEIADLVKKSYNLGQEGIGFKGKTAGEKLLREEVTAVEGLAGQLENVDTGLGKNISQALEKATNDGKVIAVDSMDTIVSIRDVAEELKKRPNLLEPEVKELLGKLIDSNLTPEEANSLRKAMRDFSASLDPRALDERNIKNATKNLSDNLNKKLTESVPEFAQANKQFSEFRSASIDPLLGKAASSVEDVSGKLKDEINVMINKISAPGTSSDAQNKAFIEIGDKLKAFDAAHPGVLNEQGFGVNAFLNTMKNQADVNSIRKAIRGWEPQGGAKKQLLGLPTMRGTILQAANTAGKMTSSIYKASPEMLKGLSDKLSASPTAKKYADMIQKALLPDASQQSKNAALFSIAQNPEARGIAKDMGLTVGSEEK
jgi:hypothetical protein